MPNLLSMFARTLSLTYKRVMPHTSAYHLEKNGDTLLIDFKWTCGRRMWFLNFMFWKKPYRGMNRKWYAHAGFLRSWKAVEPHIAVAIGNRDIKNIKVVGYSHGGTLAMMCHEFVRFHRPDIKLNSYAFGSPKVLGGLRRPRDVIERWNGFTVINIRRDFVGKLPPFYRHVGKQIRLPGKGTHRYWNYINALKQHESQKGCSGND